MQSLPKEAFTFLNELKKNNNRNWFHDNKNKYKLVQNNIKILYQNIFDSVSLHDHLQDVKLFRIYRDIRFSKDKTPYKTHFGGHLIRKKPALRGGYYIHFEPNNSFLAIGFWNPNKEDLYRIRKEFESDDLEIRTILNQKSFKKIWGNLQGEELKTAPKGFDKDHPAIDLIKKKQYIFTHQLSNDLVQSPNLIPTLNENFKIARPYFDLMSDILTTDLNGTSLL